MNAKQSFLSRSTPTKKTVPWSKLWEEATNEAGEQEEEATEEVGGGGRESSASEVGSDKKIAHNS